MLWQNKEICCKNHKVKTFLKKFEFFLKKGLTFLEKGIENFGVPKEVYFDNGKDYRS